jgi:ATP-dependent Lon protease
VYATDDASQSRREFVQVKAKGLHRFRIERVVDRTLDGLLLTCEVKIFYEKNSSVDKKNADTQLYKSLMGQSQAFCKLA